MKMSIAEMEVFWKEGVYGVRIVTDIRIAEWVYGIRICADIQITESVYSYLSVLRKPIKGPRRMATKKPPEFKSSGL
jgi:hypothetical protein